MWASMASLWHLVLLLQSLALLLQELLLQTMLGEDRHEESASLKMLQT